MGKGSDRRPRDNRFCDSETYSQRWDLIFRRKEEKNEKRTKEDRDKPRI